MRVADHNGIDFAMVYPAAKLSEDPAAAVNENTDLVGLDEVATASAACVLPSWGTADDCYSKNREVAFV
jgi:hypothetical protein